ncbi:MAG: NINE protein [Bdellovibrionales bacterium]
MKTNNHSKLLGYIFWIFGFMGAHRFYFGKQISGTLYFFTFGLLGVGWLIDLFLIPSMDRACDIKYKAGRYDYNVAWLLLVFLGIFGAHRLYQGKWITAIIYFFTGGFFLLGWLYDLWNLNGSLSELNSRRD